MQEALFDYRPDAATAFGPYDAWRDATDQDVAPLEWTLNDDDPSPPVVSTALSLWTRQQCLPALEVLDRAMCMHADEDLDFQFDGEHELAPPHPFAELIRRAFAPQLDQIELCMSFVESPLGDHVTIRSVKEPSDAQATDRVWRLRPIWVK